MSDGAKAEIASIPMDEIRAGAISEVRPGDVERYWAMFRRYLPLLRVLEGKPYGFAIVQLHGKRPVRAGYLPDLVRLGGDVGESEV
jgi:hypothetical protein